MSLRDGPLGDIKVPLTWSAAAALVIAVIIAGALLLGSRRETMKAEAYNTASHAVDAVASPVGGVLEAPVRWTRGAIDYVGGYFFAVSENRKLKADLAKTRSLHDQLDAVTLENQRYRALLGVRTDPPLPMIFAHTVSEARGPFANTRLADVGADKGVVEGNPVLSEHGVVGRIVGVSDHVSRVLMLTDPESHMPVLIVRTNGRAILSGDGGAAPKLDYVRESVALKEGDRILTSGDGGVFPRGLPVGTVVKGLDGEMRVALDADAAPVDDVQILLFKDFSQLVDERGLTPKDLPTAMTEESSQTILGPAAKPAATATAAAKTAAGAAAGATAASASAHLAVPVAGAPKAQAAAGKTKLLDKSKAGAASAASVTASKPSAQAKPKAATASASVTTSKPSAQAKPKAGAASAITNGGKPKPAAQAKPKPAAPAKPRPAPPAVEPSPATPF